MYQFFYIYFCLYNKSFAINKPINIITLAKVYKCMKLYHSYCDFQVGAVCCRVDTSENSRRLYIMTLGCLYPYRRLGIGTVMVQHVLNYVNKDGNFDSIFL